MRRVDGNWGHYTCRIVTKMTRRGSPRWRAEIDCEFASIVNRHSKGRWRKTEAEAQADGHRMLDNLDPDLWEGEPLDYAN